MASRSFIFTEAIENCATEFSDSFNYKKLMFCPIWEEATIFPFWEKRIPALMWTDTAEFRNPNYHRFSDSLDTLNYPFLKKVTQLLFLQILNSVILSGESKNAS